ncbi:hypothetical protein HYU06_04215 [Candidatus Woesearchaeota archaeon]|nr:hypothetical protein [Candidatus Woesearchaeota archaeon]
MLKNTLLKRIFLVALISVSLLIAACGKTPELPKTDAPTALPEVTQPAAQADSVSQISGAVTDASATDQELNTDDADKAVSGVGDALSDW